MIDTSAETVFITGGASGIGAATAERFAELGWRVVIADRRFQAASATAERVGGYAYELDICSEDQVREIVTAVEVNLGPIDALVNCAGPLQNTDRPEELSMGMWDRITSTHLRGTYLVTVQVGSRMAARRKGSIVTVASVMGMRSGPLHAYGPAKAALINLGEGLAAEWGPVGVRVNTVSPGFVSTPALDRGLSEKALNEDRLTRASALGRLVHPSEVANAIAFLSSSQAGAITGCNLPVDAGYLVAASWGAYGGLREKVTA